MTTSTENRNNHPVINLVLKEVADKEDCDVSDLPPIYSDIDPDAIECLVESASGEVGIEFTYSEHEVEIRGKEVSIE